MRFQALQTLAPTNAHDESRRRDVRLGVNGSWRDNYRFGVPNKQEMIGGTNHLLSAYARRGQKIWGQHGRIRAGVKTCSISSTAAFGKPASSPWLTAPTSTTTPTSCRPSTISL